MKYENTLNKAQIDIPKAIYTDLGEGKNHYLLLLLADKEYSNEYT